jgi:hypothetical protein
MVSHFVNIMGMTTPYFFLLPPVLASPLLIMYEAVLIFFRVPAEEEVLFNRYFMHGLSPG